MKTDAAANHRQRIRDHLSEVEMRLRTVSTEGWPPALAAARARSLDALRAYRDTGVFPENHAPGEPRRVPVPGGFEADPDSSPVFIDARGVPCAVGQLVIASGRRDVAEEVARTSNRAWLVDMHQPALHDWVAQSGFSAMELAAIQPTYAFEPTELPAYMGACPAEVMVAASLQGRLSQAYLTCLDDRLRHTTSAEERAAITKILASDAAARAPAPNGVAPRPHTDPIPELEGGTVGPITCTVDGETVAWFNEAQRLDLAYCGATLPPPPSVVHVAWTVQPDGRLLSSAGTSCFGRVSEHWTLPGHTGTIVCAIPFEGAEAP